jgi:hypothetical protein
VTYDPEGQLVVTGILAGGAPVGTVDLRTGVGRTLAIEAGPPGFAAAVSPDGRFLAVGRQAPGHLAVYARDDGLATLWARTVSENWATWFDEPIYP